MTIMRLFARSYVVRSLPILVLTGAILTSSSANSSSEDAPNALSTAATPGPSPAPQPTDPLGDQIYAQGNTVEIAHPYNPKALGLIPPGWVPEPIPNYSVRNPNVGLKNGSTVIIDCPIYALVPNTKAQYRGFREPGFDPAKGNNQPGTLGNILTRYLAENDELGRQIDATLIQIRSRFAVAEVKPDPNATADANRLLIDKPTQNPTPGATPEATGSPTPSPSPAASPTPAAKKKEKQHVSHNSHQTSKPKPTPAPTATPEKKFLGLFPENNKTNRSNGPVKPLRVLHASSTCDPGRSDRLGT